MMLKGRIGWGVALVSAFGIACAVARADNAPTAQRPSASSIAVSLRGLDLQRPGDVARLYRRLNAAADQVCGSRAFNVFYYTLPKYQACVDEAVQKAVAHLNEPALSAYARQ